MIWINVGLTVPVIPEGKNSVKLFCWCEGEYFEGDWDGNMAPNGKLIYVTLPSTNKRPPYLPTICPATHWMIPRAPVTTS